MNHLSLIKGIMSDDSPFFGQEVIITKLRRTSSSYYLTVSVQHEMNENKYEKKV